jgi:cytochrome c-type biogenesis protein CcmH/NrfG
MIRIIFALSILLLQTGCAPGTSGIRQTSEAERVHTELQASAAYANNDWLTSEKHYSQLISSGSGQAHHWYRLGNIYAYTGRPDAAIVAYREAIRLQPDMPEAWYNLGLIQLKQSAWSLGQLQLHAGNDPETAGQGKRLLQGIIDLIQTSDP